MSKENNIKLLKTAEKKEREKFIEELVSSVKEDFLSRQKQRAYLERQWELNMHFVTGEQYVFLDGRGELDDEDKEYFWQNKGVFNHIAPIIETRLAKFARVTPILAVRPNSDDDEDVKRAEISEKLLLGCMVKTELTEKAKIVTNWSEICGTGFYKIIWNKMGGSKIGRLDCSDVYEGEVEIIPVSPFEIFPDNLGVDNIEDCQSIMHAKAVPINVIKEMYGVDVFAENLDGLYLTNKKRLKNSAKSMPSNSALVIEKYEKPTKNYPEGRLITVCGDKLLYYGKLPYYKSGTKNLFYPFVKQESIKMVGSFFGSSIVERLIPVQRAYNAVKNRKHEFINRLSSGVMMVEDGSIDVDDLEGEGLCPGKILVYRQGSKAPEIMEEPTLPPDFKDEENKLLNEFVVISGVSDVSSNSDNAGVSSGSALQILIEQDRERMTVNAEIIRRCYKEISRHILNLYSIFISGLKLVKSKDSFGNTKVYYADKDSAMANDVYLESENELLYTESQKKEFIFKLYSSGILNQVDGKLTQRTKEKILSLLGYKDLDSRNGISKLQEEKARKENISIKTKDVEIEEIDDDVVHIEEHTRYALSEYLDLEKEAKERLYAHIKLHKDRIIKNTEKEII